MDYKLTTTLEPHNAAHLLHLTAECVSSYLLKNKAEIHKLPILIQSVYGSLAEIALNEAARSKEPAVPINQSVTDDYIICLEDGKKLKMLKRYLRRMYTMSPDEYREKWNLRSDYPMVAPNYTLKRSAIAKSLGLGLRTPKSSLKRKSA